LPTRTSTWRATSSLARLPNRVSRPRLRGARTRSRGPRHSRGRAALRGGCPAGCRRSRRPAPRFEPHLFGWTLALCLVPRRCTTTTPRQSTPLQ
jgi:hypothetical protein